MNKDSLVVCPIYNEEVYIRKFYYRLRRIYHADVAFIDDGSTDKGKNFLSLITDDNTFLVRHPRRLGYGAALNSGFKFALKRGYKRIITLDVDLQHRPEYIPVFLKELLEWEVVLGSRYINIDNYLDVPRQRLVINRYIAKLIKVLFSVDFSDPFCGFRGYRDYFLRKINLSEQSYGAALEVLLEIINTNTAFKQIPVEAIYFKDSRKFLDGLDDPRKRLLYYLTVIAKKQKQLADEEKISIGESSS